MTQETAEKIKSLLTSSSNENKIIGVMFLLFTEKLTLHEIGGFLIEYFPTEQKHESNSIYPPSEFDIMMYGRVATLLMTGFDIVAINEIYQKELPKESEHKRMHYSFVFLAESGENLIYNVPAYKFLSEYSFRLKNKLFRMMQQEQAKGKARAEVVIDFFTN